MTFMTILSRLALWMGLVLSQGQTLAAQPATGTTQGASKPKKEKPIRWQPPADVGSSGRRTGNPPPTVQGGSRNGCVYEGDLPLTALIPRSYEGRVGVEAPVLHVYFPYSGEQQVRLTVQTYTGTELLEVYQGQFLLKDAVGLVGLPLPSQLALEKDLIYRWRLSVLCEGKIGDYVEGNFSLEPRELDPEFVARLGEASPIEKAEIYLEQGWWYDAITVLSGLRTDSQGTQLWAQLLSAEGLTGFVLVQE